MEGGRGRGREAALPANGGCGLGKDASQEVRLEWTSRGRAGLGFDRDGRIRWVQQRAKWRQEGGWIVRELCP